MKRRLPGNHRRVPVYPEVRGFNAMAEPREKSALAACFCPSFGCCVVVLLLSAVFNIAFGVSGSESDAFLAGSSGLSAAAAAARDVR